MLLVNKRPYYWSLHGLMSLSRIRHLKTSKDPDRLWQSEALRMTILDQIISRSALITRPCGTAVSTSSTGKTTLMTTSLLTLSLQGWPLRQKSGMTLALTTQMTGVMLLTTTAIRTTWKKSEFKSQQSLTILEGTSRITSPMLRLLRWHLTISWLVNQPWCISRMSPILVSRASLECPTPTSKWAMFLSQNHLRLLSKPVVLRLRLGRILLSLPSIPMMYRRASRIFLATSHSSCFRPRLSKLRTRFSRTAWPTTAGR